MEKQHTVPQEWIPDDSQQRIIGLHGGWHLVLAPPGCGKTQILAERIRQAHERGVPYGDMLCLTFTNRAARGMRDRIQTRLADKDTGQVFVGNVHRFCSRFLFDYSIVSKESAVIDDDTSMSILAMYMGEDDVQVLGNPHRRRDYARVVFLSHLMVEIEHNVSKHLRQHPECLSSEDVTVLRALCQARRIPFTREAMLDIYEHVDFYLDVARSEAFDPLLRQPAILTLQRLRYAHAYQAYKRQNLLLDFEDLLLFAYLALRDGGPYKRYPWIQVDEVQDLNSMQLAIVEALSGPANAMEKDAAEQPTVVCLGDEQQAIFSFMGAKMSVLQWLKERCQGSVHYLEVNHRSPKYLVDLLNRYAIDVLHTDPDLLPKTTDCDAIAQGRLAVVGSSSVEDELNDVAGMVAELHHDHPDETVAVIVNANRDADFMSGALDKLQIAHFKVSGADLFASEEVKLLLAHLSVLGSGHQFIAWSRLLKGLGVCQSHASARRLVHQLAVRGMTPADLLDGSGLTYLQRFVQACDSGDVVVFDTETTGLDIYTDDVIQIAAARVRHGKVVDTFSVHVETSRPIPLMLGDVPNPIIEERHRQHLVAHEEALQRFLDFAHGSVLLGHNADYDYRIMEYNLKRYLPKVNWQEVQSVCFDSLRLIRLLRPDLKAYKLKLLLLELGLQGQNTHLADDDVYATVSLTNYCYKKAKEELPQQRELLSRPGVAKQADALRRCYAEAYNHGRQRLYERLNPNETPALVDELQHFYGYVVEQGMIRPVKKMPYICRYLAHDVIDAAKEPSLKQQLDNHNMEINTFKEADLCSSSTIDEQVFVSTIHKAKGLEFDNVIVFDVVDGRIPNFYNGSNAQLNEEDARKLYVAMSRAKKRLYVAYSRMKMVRGKAIAQQLSRFMNPLLGMMESR